MTKRNLEGFSDSEAEIIKSLPNMMETGKEAPREIAELHLPFYNSFEELLEGFHVEGDLTGWLQPSRPLQGMKHRMVQTGYEGRVAYVPAWNYWVRIPMGPNEKFRHGTNFFEYMPTETTEDTLFFRDLIMPNGILSGEDAEFDAWQTVLVVWDWFRQNSVTDIQEHISYTRRHQSGGWPYPQWYRTMWEERGDLLLAACNSQSIAFGQMLLCCGLDPWRLMICTARYQGMEGSLPSHVYNAVYFAGRWRYLDLTSVHTGMYPAYLPEMERPGWLQMNIGWHPNCDYQHPFSAEQPKHETHNSAPEFYCPGVPLLGVEPHELADWDPARNS